jgi:putative PIN family toxin of toxin-antitoxin system
VPKVRTTVTLNRDVLRSVRVRAAQQGKGDSEVIEESLRRDLGLDLLERIWAKNRMGEEEAMQLAVEAQHRTRPRRRKWLRVVLDPNVLISSLLSPSGRPGEILRRWSGGEFELVVSTAVLAELGRALAYPKLRSRISVDDARAFLQFLERTATMAEDSVEVPRRSRDRGDDFLLALAESCSAILVTGDEDLLSLKPLPVQSPRGFLARLRAR